MARVSHAAIIPAMSIATIGKPAAEPTRKSAAPLAVALRECGVMAVVVVDKAADALSLLNALREGGIRAIEVALRTPDSLISLTAMRSAAPDMLIGAGTVLTPAQAYTAREAGADFGLAPGLDLATVRRCSAIDFPFIPGVATPTDIQSAVAHDCRLLKFFPAATMGGLPGLQTLASPFLHLGIRFVPLGGIAAATAAPWLASPLVAAIGGSWIAPRDLIARRDWSEITRRAAEATALVPLPRVG